MLRMYAYPMTPGQVMSAGYDYQSTRPASDKHR